MNAYGESECQTKLIYYNYDYGYVNITCNTTNKTDYENILSITSNYTSCYDAWHARKCISDCLKNPTGSQIGSSFLDDAYYSDANYYIYYPENKSTLANESISKIDLDKTNYSEPEKYSPIWKLKADIQKKLGMIEANYSYAIYYELSKDANYNKSAFDFLNQVYFEDKTDNKTDMILKPERVRVWEIMGNNENNLSKKSFYYAYSNYTGDNLNNAINIINNTTNKTFRDFWYLRGLIYRNMSEFLQEAAKSFESALLGDNISNISTFNLSRCYIYLGECLIKIGEKSGNQSKISEGYYYQAEGYNISNKSMIMECINKSISNNSRNFRAWELRGKILKISYQDASNYCFAYSKYLQGDLKEADNFLTKVDLDNYIDKWILKGMISEGDLDNISSYSAYTNATKKSIILFNDTSINELYSSANLRLGRLDVLSGNYTRAKEYFYKSLTNNSSKYDTWIDIASALFYMGEFEEAQNIFNFSFNTSKILNKDTELYWNKKGEILASRGWYNASLLCFNNSTNKNQYFKRAWYNKGLAKINLKNFEGAIKDLDNATVVDSGNETDDKDIRAKAWMNKGIANSSLKRYSDALIDVDEAIRINPPDDNILADAYYTKGLFLLDLEQPVEANLSFSESLRFGNSKSKSKAFYGLGRATAKKGDYQRALRYYSKAIEIDANNEQAWIDKGKTEQLVNMYAESLISFHNALDAIKRNRARIWCDLGYARLMLPNDQKELCKIGFIKSDSDPFNKSLDLDKHLIDSYYNKSNILINSGDYKTALTVLKQAEKFDKNLTNKSKFNYKLGLIYLKDDKESSFNALIKSYNESKFNIDVLYILYNNFRNESDSCNYINKSILNSMEDIRQSTQKESAASTIADLKLLQQKLNQSNKLESDVLLNIADSKYHLNLTDDAIQSFITARQKSILQGAEIIYLNLVSSIYWLFMTVGIYYILLMLLNIVDLKLVWLLVVSNSIGFSAFAYLLSIFFDASRALWSLILQGFIFLCVLSFFLFVFNYREWKWMDRAEAALKDLIFERINHCKLLYISIFIIILISFMVPIISMQIQSDKGNIINTYGFNIVRNIMFSILGLLIPITTIPLGLALASGRVDSDLRKILAAAQFGYLSVSSVPLVWLFWSYGMPIAFPTKIPIEDEIINLPLYSITLSILFFIAFVYPYFIGQKKYNHILSDILSKQEDWIASAEKSPNDIKNLIETIYREMIRVVEWFFGNKMFCVSKGHLNAFYKSNGIEDVQNSTNKYLELKEMLSKERLWDEDDIKAKLLLNSQKIIQIANENKDRDNLSHLKDNTIIKPSSVPLKISVNFGELNNNFVFENPHLIDPFASLKKEISDCKSKAMSSSALWPSYITIFMSPVITLAISWIVSIMRIPVDKGDLTQLISNAVSTPVPLI